MERTSTETGLLEAGVRNLKEFGYETVDTENIMTDMIYSKFFRSMLEDNRGHGRHIDEAIDKLIAEIDANETEGAQ